jgi:hypothetical protein
VDKNDRNSKACVFFPHTAGDVTPNVILPPHEAVVRRKAGVAQSLLRLPEADRRDVIRHDPQALSGHGVVM